MKIHKVNSEKQFHKACKRARPGDKIIATKYFEITKPIVLPLGVGVIGKLKCD